MLLGGSAYGLVTGLAAPAPPAPFDGPVAPLQFLQSDLYTVARRPLTVTLPLTGTIAPLVRADVKAKVAGELTEVTVREGERVREGEVLARIDTAELAAAVSARRADVAAAGSELALARKNLRQQKSLLGKGFISRSAFENVESNAQVAEAKLRVAQADLARSKEALGNGVLRAPFSGTVAQRLAQPGEHVAVGAPVVSLVDLSRMELTAPVPAAEIARVAVGQTVSFRVEGFDGHEFAGRLDRINPVAAAGTHAIDVHVVIDNPEGALRGGMFAAGHLLLRRIEAALPIPESALHRRASAPFVYALKSGYLQRLEVEPGVRTRQGMVDVTSGLEPGDVIVRTDLGELREGAPVDVVHAD